MAILTCKQTCECISLQIFSKYPIQISRDRTNPPDLPTLKAYPTPGVGGRFGIFSLKWRERMNLKVPLGGLVQPPLGELGLMGSPLEKKKLLPCFGRYVEKWSCAGQLLCHPLWRPWKKTWFFMAKNRGVIFSKPWFPVIFFLNTKTVKNVGVSQNPWFTVTKKFPSWMRMTIITDIVITMIGPI